MTYNVDSHIRSVEDVKAFFHYLVDERKLNFHPDDDFADYVNYEDNTPTFTKAEVELYNSLMEEAFSACDAAGIDIYEIGFHEPHGALMI